MERDVRTGEPPAKGQVVRKLHFVRRRRNGAERQPDFRLSLALARLD
jgi:hypothetical protein